MVVFGGGFPGCLDYKSRIVIYHMQLGPKCPYSREHRTQWYLNNLKRDSIRILLFLSLSMLQQNRSQGPKAQCDSYLKGATKIFYFIWVKGTKNKGRRRGWLDPVCFQELGKAGRWKIGYSWCRSTRILVHVLTFLQIQGPCTENDTGIWGCVWKQ